MSVVRPPEFDPRWRRRRRWSQRWRAWRASLFIAAIIVLSIWWYARPADTAAVAEIEQTFTICGERGSEACVIDGDTLALGQRRIRLTGYDAPELDGACPAEEAKAREAREVVQAWLNDGPFMIDGGQQPPRDQYGRELRAAKRLIDGRSEALSDWMIDRGLASGTGWVDAEIDWCAAN